MAHYTLGIDIGTSSVKAGMLDRDSFDLSCITARAYNSSAEQDASIIWAQTAEAVKESVGMLPEGAEVEAIGLSGQMHGTVLYDCAGNIIGPVINWQDKRCDKPLQKYSGRTTIDVMTAAMGQKGLEDLGIDVMARGHTCRLRWRRQPDEHSGKRPDIRELSCAYKHRHRHTDLKDHLPIP